ncbi:MAG: vanadium-dependent haloperoxidase [Sediminibacterium sp.]|jgi:hypothetical protein
MKFRYQLWSFLLLAATAVTISCQPPKERDLTKLQELQYQCVQHLTDVIVYDIVNPPVASRMYAYSTIAYYEALQPTDASYASLLPKLHGFAELPLPDTTQRYDYRLSAVIAFMKVSEALVFSKDSIRAAREELVDYFSDLDQEVYTNSVSWGEKVANTILARASKDGYKLTRGMPKFSVLKETGIWQQTPPDYEEAIEPNWRFIQPLLLDSASQFKPARPPAYNMNASSQYHKEVKEVYELSQQLTEEQKLIARFWDDNPFVSEHKGHLTYANKKMTPVGHWMGITGILSSQSKKTALDIARVYALTAAAIFDGFISTWEEKYTSKTVRPVTVIREHLASEWNPILQTPPFPEYTSGHSVISAAAASVLAAVFGNNTAFRDTTELPYLGLERSFSSLQAASDEVSMSRVYGGIHYRSAVINGQKQGQQIGDYFIGTFLK